MLAVQLRNLGNKVIVATNTLGEDVVDGIDIVRKPSFLKLFRLLRTCDVCLISGVPLRQIACLWLARRPLVAIHHGWYSGKERRQVIARAKNWVARHLLTNIFVSEAVGKMVPAPGTVIANPYDDRHFKTLTQGTKSETRNLLFVGRLVAEKGIITLIEALHRLHATGLNAVLTVVGDGPERASAVDLVKSRGLDQSVTFCGFLDAQQTADQMRKHRLVVVPSNYEPFGIVALEAFACGCSVVASRTGGLVEAVGSCGKLVTPGDVSELTEVLQDVLSTNDEDYDSGRVERHLAPRRPRAVAVEYLKLLEKVGRRSNSPL